MPNHTRRVQGIRKVRVDKVHEVNEEDKVYEVQGDQVNEVCMVDYSKCPSVSKLKPDQLRQQYQQRDHLASSRRVHRHKFLHLLYSVS